MYFFADSSYDGPGGVSFFAIYENEGRARYQSGQEMIGR
jgi:hypothetical protein